MSLSEIADLPDVTEGLENLIKSAANSCNTIDELISIVKSKRYTVTRLKRILLYCLLGITKKDMQNSKKVTPYIRVLGFNPKLDIVTSPRKYLDQSNNKILKSMLEKDIFATDVYTLGYDYDSCSNLDFTHPIINL